MIAITSFEMKGTIKFLISTKATVRTVVHIKIDTKKLKVMIGKGGRENMTEGGLDLQRPFKEKKGGNGLKTEKGLDQDPGPILEMKRGKGPKTDGGQGPKNTGGTHGLSHTRKKARSPLIGIEMTGGLTLMRIKTKMTLYQIRPVIFPLGRMFLKKLVSI